MIDTYEEVHAHATVVDLHAHPIFKRFFVRRSLIRPMWAPSCMAGALNPFTVQTSFANLNVGGVDVLLSTAYPVEKRVVQDIKTFKIVPLRILRWLPFTLARDLWQNVVVPPYFDVAMAMFDTIEEEVGKYNAKIASQGIEARSVQVARSRADFQALLNMPKPPIILLHGIEGGHALEGAVALEHIEESWDSLSPAIQQAIAGEIFQNLETLAKRGLASIIPAHFYPNRLMMSTFPYPDNIALEHLPRATFEKIWSEIDLTQGATEIGKQAIQKMIDLGILIDVSHASPRARRDIYEIVNASGCQRPCVVATHVGAYEINPSPYNLEDWEVRWIAGHGGVVGVIFMTYWLKPSATRMGIDAIAQTIDHLLNVGGEDAVSLGTDFDGADPPDDLVDSSQMRFLTMRLFSEQSGAGFRKYTDAQIEKILGGNALRVLLEGWMG